MNAPELALVALVIGLVAGAVGGMAGIGGSIIMLPALGIIVGYETATKAEQHLYQASAMCVNVVVAYAASRRHQQVGVHDPGLRRALLPGLLLGIAAGVVISDLLRGEWLKFILVGFLFAYCIQNLISSLTTWRPTEGTPELTGSEAFDLSPGARNRLRLVGGLTGVPSGLLGIGGGIIMVPLMQVWARVPLKRAIAASASVMWVSAIVGAAIKVTTLPTHGQSRADVLYLAGPMAIGAAVGSPVGAGLTHSLRLPHLKLAISLVLVAAGLRLIGVI